MRFHLWFVTLAATALYAPIGQWQELRFSRRDIVRMIPCLRALMVAGIKDPSGDWENTKACIDNSAAQDFNVFPGSETFLLQGLRRREIPRKALRKSAHRGQYHESIPS